jgi:23S rRNA (adenine-N6)-dimethyltransferase
VAVRRRPARGAPGQHFLRSSRLSTDLVREAGISAGELVVEIGAGSGLLTRALAQTGADVIALELDRALASGLRRRFADTRNVTVVEADACHWGWPRRRFSVVSNLPFARSGAILGRLLRDPGVPLERADLIVQWELASKHAAVWPGTLRATYWRAWYELSIAGRFARTAFSPTPGVDAAVFRVVRRPCPMVPAVAFEAYWRFLSAAFASREPVRRSLALQLSSLQVKRLAPALGFSPDARPWDLDARQWARLFEFAAAHRPKRR